MIILPAPGLSCVRLVNFLRRTLASTSLASNLRFACFAANQESCAPISTELI